MREVGQFGMVRGCFQGLRRFHSLGLSPNVLRSVLHQGFDTPTPVQRQAIPPLLAGRDVIGIAQTGTGKTAAFTLPVLEAIERERSSGSVARRDRRPRQRRTIRALLLAPTRELAAQIGESLIKYSSQLEHTVKHHVIFGGVGQHAQVLAIKQGLDVLVATPGRLLDLHKQGHVDLQNVNFFVLDEADRMLDMGFQADIKKVLQILPSKGRQNLLFSATMPKSIANFASTFINDAVTVEVTPSGVTSDRIDQKVCYVNNIDKPALLSNLVHLFEVERGIVFTRTKHRANRLVKTLLGHFFMRCLLLCTLL